MEPPPLTPITVERPGEGSDDTWMKKKVVLGICVMEKKALSGPMTQILDRLRAFGEFEVVVFGDKVILEDPIENWPICDALIAFHSSGYPLEKAKAYASLRRPFLVNQLDSQYILHDRRKVYKRLEDSGLPVPCHAVVNRDFPGQDLDYFVEDEDYVEVKGQRINKPFVEKPVDGDDHSVMIYYPSSAGGGMKELFRKIGNRSSEFHPEVRSVRRGGSYLYEEFMATGGTDVKVYTVGPDYAHAEARKSPVLDGVVMRSADGKEIRYPVLLTPMEKEMARIVTLTFGQAVCGFDLLRSQGKSYVCDVNGWSFVKNSHKYYDDAACVLRGILLSSCAPHLYSPLPPCLPWTSPAASISSSSGDAPAGGAVVGDASFQRQVSVQLSGSGSGSNSSSSLSTFGQREELRCVIAVIRHGDRTPKQKVKLKVTQERLLSLMMKYNGGRPRSEAKLKSAVQLQDLLDALRMLVPKTRFGRDSDSEAEDFENSEKLRHVKAVLEEGGRFSGIYRKAQLKPLKWVSVVKEEEGEGEEGGEEGGGEAVVERPSEALMVLKYGGVLTHAGRKQAEELGRMFRFNMYPVEAGERGGGLIRLHSTYRHDLKIYSSDEGRVQMSAAAFTKGLLDLEGPLTPILVSLVSKDSSMLDGLDTASSEMEQAKERLYALMTASGDSASEERVSEVEGQPWMVDGGGVPPGALEKLKRLRSIVKDVTVQMKERCREEEEIVLKETKEETAKGKSILEAGDDVSSSVPYSLYYNAVSLSKSVRLETDKIAAGLPCGAENFLLMFARWKKLERDLYSDRKDRFDISKIPDIYDSVKYDLVHNQHLGLKRLDELYQEAKVLADGVIPNEYGINPHQKLAIGTKVARKLLGKLVIDLENTIEDSRRAVETKVLEPSPSSVSLLPLAEGGSTTPRILTRHNSRSSNASGSSGGGMVASEREEEEDAKETPYRLHPQYANVRSPQRHVRTRLYFTSESHIHSLMNVLRYGYLDECMEGAEPLLSQAALTKLFHCTELDYLTHFVIRMYENVEVSFDDPKRFRIELLFSPGAAYNPLEVVPRNRDHVLPVVESEPMQEENNDLSYDRMQKMLKPFAMPAEDFPPPAMPQSFSGFFTKTNTMFERLANLWPFNQLTTHNVQVPGRAKSPPT